MTEQERELIDEVLDNFNFEKVKKVMDALFYSTYLSKIKTEGEYFEYLRQNYAEDPMYVQRLKALISKRDLKNKF